MMVYVLLDGCSFIGVYCFDVCIGDNIVMDVQVCLFICGDIEKLGIVLFISMFFYGGNIVCLCGEWWFRVYDFGGLLLYNGVSGEWFWCLLLNLKSLKLDYFQIELVQGFGLMQWQMNFEDFQDYGVNYYCCLSVWVQFEGDWGKGRVVLV